MLKVICMQDWAEVLPFCPVPEAFLIDNAPELLSLPFPKLSYSPVSGAQVQFQCVASPEHAVQPVLCSTGQCDDVRGQSVS